MHTGFYSEMELKSLGLKVFGKNVQISIKVSLYNIDKIEIGDNVRIDDFAILIGPIRMGSYIHIGAGSILTGGELGIILENFTGISSGCKIFSVTDDYSGSSMANPMIPRKFRQITSNKIIFKKHSIIGSNSVILPFSGGLEEGVSVGALSLVSRPTKSYGVYFGLPARRIAERSKELLQYEKEFLREV